MDTLKEAFTANTLVFPDDMSAILQVRLLDAAMQKNTLTDFLDVSREISDRLLNNADRIMSFEERAVHTKTRQYTYSRIKRALIHIVLGIGEEEFGVAKRNGYADYIRILGFRKDAREKGLLKNLKKNALVPVITKTADNKELLKRDIYRDQIYFSLKNQKGELQRSPVIV